MWNGVIDLRKGTQRIGWVDQAPKGIRTKKMLVGMGCCRGLGKVLAHCAWIAPGKF